ncbi:Uncharacterised protein [Zhongshania aliphaticivorans]|uniref:Uncharacterized protein n=1 Tax=Zhongshania aliphaticivorans TaxID=1470434 RepID=A0A5S9N6A7_9GAMM|nr:hypothetical protein [Zhongshania aliphaticivorans]CAA0081007.1 Uncharacterised protein [Zhongshania aliphaticivorans]CAA0085333.1 Uncharacterised protein [Zhongshania aliphaticivorans]
MRQKLIFLLCAVFILTGLWLVMKPKMTTPTDGSNTATTTAYYFAILSGSIPEPQVIKLKLGDVAQLGFVSDKDAAVHIHGVEMHIELSAGVKENVTFTATQVGRFALEVHVSEVQLGTIEVYPR